MSIQASWIHEELVTSTTLDFAKRALPDSVLAQWPETSTPYPLAYDITDAVPDAYGNRAYHVHVALELMVQERADAELMFTIEDPIVGTAYVRDTHAVREGYDDPTRTLTWNEEEGLWETIPED